MQLLQSTLTAYSFNYSEIDHSNLILKLCVCVCSRRLRAKRPYRSHKFISLALFSPVLLVLIISNTINLYCFIIYSAEPASETSDSIQTWTCVHTHGKRIPPPLSPGPQTRKRALFVLLIEWTPITMLVGDVFMNMGGELNVSENTAGVLRQIDRIEFETSPSLHHSVISVHVSNHGSFPHVCPDLHQNTQQRMHSV